MKILLLNHEFPPLGGGGGRVCYELARRFIKKNHAVTVLTTSFKDLPAYENVEGIDIHRVYGSRKSELDNNVLITSASFLWAGKRLAQKLIQQHAFDLIHAYFSVPAGLLGTQLKRQYHLPLIVSPHGSDVPHHNPEKLNLPIRLLAPLIRQIWQKADRLITVSHGLKKTIQQTTANLPCSVIHNGIDTEHFVPPKSLRNPSNRIELIAVGRLVRLKGLQHLIEALAILKNEGQNFRMQIAGDGNYREALTQQIHKYNLEKSVQLIGHVPYAKLPELYQQADAFVLPSLAESFGQVFAEAMACGLPVIGSTTGGIPEVVGPHQHPWLITPGDINTLVDKLRLIMANATDRQNLGRQNAAYIRKHFAWSSVADSYLNHYQDLLQTLHPNASPSITPTPSNA